MIFVDTSFWIALNARRDRWHAQAVGLFRAYADAPLMTTNHVVAETWTFARRRYGHEPAVKLLDLLGATDRLVQSFVDRELERDAWDWLRRRDEREYSFVDAASFAVMRRNGIREAFAFDGDFAAAGFVELRP